MSSEKINVEIRRLQKSDWNAAISLWAMEGWLNEDWALELAAGSLGAFLMPIVGEEQKASENMLIGTGCWFNYGENFGVIGYICVAQTHRRRGIAKRIVDSLIEDAVGGSNRRTLLLSSAKDAVNLYRKSGFEPILVAKLQAYKFEWPNENAVAANVEVEKLNEYSKALENIRVRKIEENDLQMLANLEKMHSGFDRFRMIEAIFKRNGTNGIILEGAAAAKGGKNILGWAFSFIDYDTNLFGPLYAANLDCAKMLIVELLNKSNKNFNFTILLNYSDDEISNNFEKECTEMIKLLGFEKVDINKYQKEVFF